MQPDLFDEIVRLRRERFPAALATVVGRRGSTPGRLAQKMIVLGDGRIVGTIGGGCVEADVIRASLSVIDTGQARKMKFELNGEEAERTGLACGGTVEIMIETLNEPWLYVIGCGHVGQRIGNLAKTVGFRLTVLDDRPDFASPAAFPNADEVICRELGELGDALDVGANGFIISVTRGHNHDYEVMKWALTTPARYIGVIGSKSKRVQFFRRLREEGFDESELERVHCPVGLDIGADSPDEIAVSVVAALISKNRLGV